MWKAPREMPVGQFVEECQDRNTTLQQEPDGTWVPARWLPRYVSFWEETQARFRLAWLVFKGDADALTYSAGHRIDEVGRSGAIVP